MLRLFSHYERYLNKYPILTSSIQTGILMATGDLIAQTCIEGKTIKNVDMVRTAQFGGMGVFFVGPTVTTWYRLLARTFGAGGPVIAIKKVACDQLLFAPVFLGTFLSVLNVVKGTAVINTIQETNKIYVDVLVTNYQLWPWVILGNFSLVPVRYQVLVTQLVAVGWNTYLSWKSESAAKITTNSDLIQESNVQS